MTTMVITDPVVSGSALGALNGEKKWVDTVLELNGSC